MSEESVYVENTCTCGHKREDHLLIPYHTEDGHTRGACTKCECKLLTMKRQFYTPYGWEGKQYERTRDLPLKEIGQRIKKEILRKHPDIKVSVSTEFFSCGCAVNIRVKSVPLFFC